MKTLSPKELRDGLLSSVIKGNLIDVFLKINRNAFQHIDKQLVDILDEYLRAKKHLPTDAHSLKTHINAELRDKEQITILEGYVDKLYAIPTISVGDIYSYVDSINKISAIDLAKEKALELADAVTSKSLEEVTKGALELATVATLTSPKSPIKGDRLVYEPETVANVECCFPTLTKHKVKLAGLSLISAVSGGGKSVMTLKQLHHTFTVEKKSVCLINLELPLPEILARLYCIANKKDFSKVYGNPREKMAVNKWIAEYFAPKPDGQEFYIASGQGYTEVDLEGTILAMASLGVKLIAVDYLNLVTPSETQKGDNFLFMANLAKKMHRVAIENKLVILSPVQVNSSDVKTNKGGDLNITTRGSRELEFSASLWLHIHSTPEERAEGLGRIFTIKSRNSEKVTVQIEYDLQHMDLIDDGEAIL